MNQIEPIDLLKKVLTWYHCDMMNGNLQSIIAEIEKFVTKKDAKDEEDKD